MILCLYCYPELYYIDIMPFKAKIPAFYPADKKSLRFIAELIFADYINRKGFGL